jgi:chemotaxis protein MotB
MRAQARRVAYEEEEESAFVSMTDMTVGFLFIIMILLAFFASQIRNPDETGETVLKETYDAMVVDRNYWRYLANAHELQIAELEAEKATLKTEVAILIREHDLLTAKLADAEEIILSQRDNINELEDEVRILKTKIADLERHIAELIDHIRKKERELKQLKEKLAAAVRDSKPLERYLARVASARKKILQQIQYAMNAEFPNLNVELSEESDALRFQGEGLFRTGSPTLVGRKKIIVMRLAEKLDEVLSCYALGKNSTFSESCNPGYVMIEAVQIEGHTDSVGQDLPNRMLSANRAISTFSTMTKRSPNLRNHLNLRLQPVLSVAAYGPDRPVADNETKAGKASNRRIDLRFIMVTPQSAKEIERIREVLSATVLGVQ